MWVLQIASTVLHTYLQLSVAPAFATRMIPWAGRAGLPDPEGSAHRVPAHCQF